MVRKFLTTILALSLLLPAYSFGEAPTTPIQPIKFQDRTFCTVFSIDHEEGNWASAGHCALFAMEAFNETAMLPTINGEEAIVGYIDREYDLAVFQTNVRAPRLKLAKDPAEIGEKITIIGYPYGLTRVQTRGIVGARNIPIKHPTPFYSILMRSDILDITVAGGNSGSPVLNEKGEVVGVLWGTFSGSPHALSIPLEAVKRGLGKFWKD